MQEYYIVRQPLPFGGMPGPFQGIQFPFGRPPFGFPPGQGPGFPPGQGPGGPPFGPPGGGQGSGPPSGPPPSFVPQQPTFGTFAVDPGAIRPCLFRFVYIWLDNRQQFWAWLTFVGRRSVAGWRWTGFNWAYFGVDINRIVSFTCF